MSGFRVHFSLPQWSDFVAAGFVGQALESPLDFFRLPFVRAWVLLMLITGVSLILISTRFGAWHRLADLYPAAPRRGTGRRAWAGTLVVGRGSEKNTTWLEIDDSHLHIYSITLLRLLRRPLSIPLSDIIATPDAAGLLSQGFIRLTFAREPRIRFMVWPTVFERLAAASGGRLRLSASRVPPDDADDFRSPSPADAAFGSRPGAASRAQKRS